MIVDPDGLVVPVDLLTRFRAPILHLPEHVDDAQLRAALALRRHGRLLTAYTPFEAVNTRARVVLVGITPGMTQLRNAVATARRMLAAGEPMRDVLIAAKNEGAFSGAMRANLIGLLDHIGLPVALGLSSSAELFDSRRDLLHSTSVLRNAVFVGDKNYSKDPDILRSDFLRGQVDEWFIADLAYLRQAVVIPLGATAAVACSYAARSGHIDEERLLLGVPHPSGANNERISYFLGRKPASALSRWVNATEVDSARERLREQVSQLR